MSLYNAILGINPQYVLLLRFIRIPEVNIPRFRDAYIAEKDGELVIAVYTRVGGGNRGHWDFGYEEYSPGPECPCPGCQSINVLEKHEAHIGNVDDERDSTYATYFFHVTEEEQSVLRHLKDNSDPETNVPPSERVEALIAELKSGADTPGTRRAREVGKHIFDKIKDAPDGGVIDF